MQALPDYSIMDFSGGIHTEKSIYQLQKNELMFALNMELESGRMTKRLGGRQFGGFDVTPNASERFTYGIYNQTLGKFLIANKNTEAQNGMVYKLISGSVQTAITTSDTTITIRNCSSFPTNGTVEIEGDIISFTGNNTAQLTGVTGITSAHPVGAAVHLWQGIYAAATNTDNGVWFAYLNSLLVISRGNRGYDTYDGTTVTNRASSSAPKFITTYKQRVYGASPVATPHRVYFTELSDPTSFPIANYFDVEDDRGEAISNLKNYSGKLMIFKVNSTYYYNLSVLNLANDQIGTYNDQTVQEINGLLYTLCPRGAFVTNGASFREIGKPVEKFLKAANTDRFPPTTGRYKDKWLIYLGDLTLDQLAYTDLVLVYDTVNKNWVVWDNFTDLSGFVSLESYQDNYSPYYGTETRADRPTLFWGDTASNRFYRMFNDKTFGSDGVTSTSGVVVGGDLNNDKFYDTGVAIPCEALLAPIHQGYPGWWKRFQFLRVLCDMPFFSVDVRTLNERGWSSWKSLGMVKGKNHLFPVDMEGYQIQIRVIERSQNRMLDLNGFILEKTLLLSQQHV